MVVKKDAPLLTKSGNISNGKPNGGAGRGQGRKPKERGNAKSNSYIAASRISSGGVIEGNWQDTLEDDAKFPALPTTATPLDVMVEAMRRAYRLGGPIAAFPFAEKAAPFLHAKISSIELKTPTAGAAVGQGTRFLVEFVRANPPKDV
jgi:hypothetical protein